jgi:hypothetical protein
VYFSHDVGADPVQIAQQLLQTFPGSIIVSIGVPGINGQLSPIDYTELLGISGGIVQNVFNITDITQINTILQPVKMLIDPCQVPCMLNII